MTKYERSQKRQDQRFRASLNKKMTVREGGRAARISKSAYHRKKKALCNLQPNKLHHKREFSEAEEEVICNTIIGSANLRKP